MIFPATRKVLNLRDRLLIIFPECGISKADNLSELAISINPKSITIRQTLVHDDGTHHPEIFSKVLTPELLVRVVRAINEELGDDLIPEACYEITISVEAGEVPFIATRSYIR